MRKPTAPIVIWIATALLHREGGADATFTERAIVDRALRIGKHERGTYETQVHQRVLATNTSGEGRHAYLVRSGRPHHYRYRLYRPGDPAHGRRRKHTSPLVTDMPAEYRHLVAWYEATWPREETVTLAIPLDRGIRGALQAVAAQRRTTDALVARDILTDWAGRRQDPLLGLAGIGRGGLDDAEEHDTLLYGP